MPIKPGHRRRTTHHRCLRPLQYPAFKTSETRTDIGEGNPASTTMGSEVIPLAVVAPIRRKPAFAETLLIADGVFRLRPRGIATLGTAGLLIERLLTPAAERIHALASVFEEVLPIGETTFEVLSCAHARRALTASHLRLGLSIHHLSPFILSCVSHRQRQTPRSRHDAHHLRSDARCVRMRIGR